MRFLVRSSCCSSCILIFKVGLFFRFSLLLVHLVCCWVMFLSPFLPQFSLLVLLSYVITSLPCFSSSAHISPSILSVRSLYLHTLSGEVCTGCSLCIENTSQHFFFLSESPSIKHTTHTSTSIVSHACVLSFLVHVVLSLLNVHPSITHLWNSGTRPL